MFLIFWSLFKYRFVFLHELFLCFTEAHHNQKSYIHHIAHMIIHGVLHILGYDHINDKDANIMESLEIATLEKFNIQNPYQ